MSKNPTVCVQHADRLFVGGAWVRPISGALLDVVDSATEEVFLSVAAAGVDDIGHAVTAARNAFDDGPWPRMTHEQRGGYLRAIAHLLSERSEDVAQLCPRQSGVLYSKVLGGATSAARVFEYYAGLATQFPFEEQVARTDVGELALLVREPVGVVAAIIPWNGPLLGLANKLGAALLSGCTVVIKASPEAPGEAYLIAEIAQAVDLPPGVINVVTADREESEALVRDPRVDMVSFTGSTAVGRRIAGILAERIGRVGLELGGKSAALVLDDADLDQAANLIATVECNNAGQVCSSLTRVIVGRHRHDELVAALASVFSAVVVGDPFESDTMMGPLASDRQRTRVEQFISAGVTGGAELVVGGGRPAHLDRGYFIQPTIFAGVDNSSVIAQNEIFGPVLCVIPADGEDETVALANDTIYGLNASVFTRDPERALRVARRIRSGTVGHNSFRRTDFGLPVGGFKQSGIGREGGREGLSNYLEVKSVVLQDVLVPQLSPAAVESTDR